MEPRLPRSKQEEDPGVELLSWWGGKTKGGCVFGTRTEHEHPLLAYPYFPRMRLRCECTHAIVLLRRKQVYPFFQPHFWVFLITVKIFFQDSENGKEFFTNLYIISLAWFIWVPIQFLNTLKQDNLTTKMFTENCTIVLKCSRMHRLFHRISLSSARPVFPPLLFQNNFYNTLAGSFTPTNPWPALKGHKGAQLWNFPARFLRRRMHICSKNCEDDVWVLTWTLLLPGGTSRIDPAEVDQVLREECQTQLVQPGMTAAADWVAWAFRAHYYESFDLRGGIIKFRSPYWVGKAN